MITSYENLRINGLHYVRELKNHNDERCFYILNSPENKPIKEVFDYLLKRKKYYGDSLNTAKRRIYNLSYFYDYIALNKINFEDITYSEMYDFIVNYLRKIELISYNDCIERSIVKKFPFQNSETSSNVRLINKEKTNLDLNTIRKIVIDTKQFLEFLVFDKKLSINLDNIYQSITFKPRNQADILSYNRPLKIAYSSKGLLKATKVPFYNNKRCKPIEQEIIFELDEERKFKKALQLETPLYQLFFHMLFITGARVSELLATQYIDCPIIENKYDFINLRGDIECLDDDEWLFKVVVRDDNPPDLSVKFNKERSIEISDSRRILKSLMEAALIQRKYILKKNKIQSGEMKFFFIYQNGKRFKYHRIREKFNEICINAGLANRVGRGKLTIHSTRHSFATKWIETLIETDDVELDLLSRILGHSSVQTTKDIYSHFYKKRMKQILSKIEEVDG